MWNIHNKYPKNPTLHWELKVRIDCSSQDTNKPVATAAQQLNARYHLIQKLNEEISQQRQNNPMYDLRMSRRDSNDRSWGQTMSTLRSYRDRSGSTYRSGSRTRYMRWHQLASLQEARERSRRDYLSTETGQDQHPLPGVTLSYNYSHTRAPHCCMKSGVNHKTANTTSTSLTRCAASMQQRHTQWERVQE